MIKKKKAQKNLLKPAVFFGFAAIIVLVDQITKYGVIENLALDAKKTIIPGFFNLWHIQNTGAGFGLFKNFTFYLIWISVIVTGVILYYYPKIIKDRKMLVLCSSILGGTIGNLIDRVRLGYVTDFLDFYVGRTHFATFNIADAFITVSAIGLIIYLWRKD